MTLTPNVKRKKPVVFIIDDDEAILDALKAILSMGFTVETSTHATMGVERIRTLCPDVVVVDLKMPQRDGFWAFSEIRKFNREVPIIINSAYQEIVPPEDLRDAFRPFANLQKGGSASVLIDAVKKAAAHSAAAPAAT
jgi:CheY-like chemotaxis protein